MRLFNARDYEGVLDHFAEPFELVFAGHVFRTKDEVRRFYAFFHAYVDEQVTVHRLVSDGKMMALEADVRLEARDDLTPEMLARNGLAGLAPLQRGAGGHNSAVHPQSSRRTGQDHPRPLRRVRLARRGVTLEEKP
ncbi:MAG: nuclear transport factor 2 family protein [Allosphingosinicella sp.]